MMTCTNTHSLADTCPLALFLCPSELLMESATTRACGNMAIHIRFAPYLLRENYSTSFQAHPISCAAALAVQRVIESENLLENCRIKGAKLEVLLRDRLQGPNALAAPFMFDIRGGGGFWGIEFDFESPQASSINFKGKRFAMLVQARCLELGLIAMGLTGGANIEGTKGDHLILAPPFNVTDEEVEKIVAIFVRSVEEILREHFL